MKNHFLHERESCIGCGVCAAMDSENWKMNEDGKSDLLGSEKIEKNEKKNFEEENLEKNMEIAQCCPVNIIHIYDKEKKLI